MGGGERTSMGVLVPTVEAEPVNDGEAAAPAAAAVEAVAEEVVVAVTEKVKTEKEEEEEVDKDIVCPICMQIIKDAFLTACGHSYCYMCIVTHLQNKSDCPCCSHYLTTNHIYPNFLLNKLLMKRSARQMAKSATPVEQLRQAIQQGCEVSVKELDSLLSLLMDKKRKMEQEEAETNLQILLEFLRCLKKQKKLKSLMRSKMISSTLKKT